MARLAYSTRSGVTDRTTQLLSIAVHIQCCCKDLAFNASSLTIQEAFLMKLNGKRNFNEFINTYFIHVIDNNKYLTYVVRKIEEKNIEINVV